MKRITVPLITLLALAGTALLVSCDWSSGSQNNFNTSGFSGITNISGFYRGNLEGGGNGLAVSKIGPGNILNFTVQQSGNRLNVNDNQGSSYTGQVGAPATIQPPGASSIPAGTVLSTYQVAWSGRDNVAGRDIEFSGTVSLITTRIIQGEISGRTTAGPGSTTSFLPVGNIVDGEVVSATQRAEVGSNQSSQSGVTFVTAEQNTQFRLQGTWVEIGGRVANVDAIAPGIAGAIEFNAPAPDIPDPGNIPALPTPIPPGPTPTPEP